MYDKLNNLYKNDIINKLLKNDVVIYGKFIRNILIEGILLKDFLSNSPDNIITCYALSAYKNIITRDLDKYTIGILDNEPITSSILSHLIIYIINYKETFFFIHIIYIKSYSFNYLDTYLSKLNIILDIDCLYIDRKHIGLLPDIYENSPIPISKIINNIKNKHFKIIGKIDKLTYDYIYSLKNKSWINVDNRLKFYNDFSQSEKLNIIKEKCGVCYEKFNIFIYKLPCRHYFHIECLNKYISNNLDQDFILCPYCTRSYSLINLK